MNTRLVLLVSSTLALGCPGAGSSAGEAGAVQDTGSVAETVTVPDVEAVSDLPDAEDAPYTPDGLPVEVYPEAEDTVSPGCGLPGVPPEAVRCPTRAPFELAVTGGALVGVLPSEGTTPWQFARFDAAGAVVQTLPFGVVGQPFGFVPCGGDVCFFATDSTDWQSPRTLRAARAGVVAGGDLRLLEALAPLTVAVGTHIRGIAIAHSDPPAMLFSNGPTGVWSRCSFAAESSCVALPMPVECAQTQQRWVTGAVETPVSTIVAGHCEDPVTAASGFGHPFAFEWVSATGVTWTVGPDWSGRLHTRLHAAEGGTWTTALHLPNGGSDDTGSPLGVSARWLATGGDLGASWDSPTPWGISGGLVAATLGPSLLVAWVTPLGETTDRIRTTRLEPDGSAVTSDLVTEAGYFPERLVRLGDGFVLSVERRLVRLDSAGKPMAWPLTSD